MSFTHLKKQKQSQDAQFFVPKDYQKQCIEFGLSRPSAGFLLRPGLGKTSIVLFVFLILRRLGLIDELFVLAEKQIMFNVWPQEIAKWRQTRSLKIVTLHGPQKLRDLYARADVRVMNYEGLQWLIEQHRWRRTDTRIMLACDESEKVQNTNTQRFRALKKLLPKFCRRYVLTGSPASKKGAGGILKLFGQTFVLDGGETFGPYITHFRNEFFYPSGYLGYQWELMPGARKKIFKMLKPVMIRFGDDQLQLPELTFVDRTVQLPASARKIYKTLEKDFLIELKRGDIVAANAAVKSMKLRQCASGAVLYSERKSRDSYKIVHTEKAENLLQLLNELGGEPALVYYEFRHEVEAVRKHFGSAYKDFPAVNGDTSQSKVQAYLKEWNRGEHAVMFSNITRGLNMQGRGGIVVYYSLPWSLSKYQQFYMRVHRQGQTKRVMVYRILATDTVEEDMIANLYKSEVDQDKFFKAMEKRNGLR